MTRQIYDELDLLSQFWKKYPVYFNDWEKNFARSTVDRFKMYGAKTRISDGQEASLKKLVTKLQTKLNKDIIG